MRLIDWNDGYAHTVLLGSAREIRFAHPRQRHRYVLIIEGYASGPVKWPKSVKWAGGKAPTLTAQKTIVMLYRAGRYYFATSQEV